MADSSNYQRTQVKTTRPATGVYQTLSGEFQIRQSPEKQGHWDLYRRDGDGWVEVARTIKGSDAALTLIVERGLSDLTTLNTPPEKPKPPKPQGPKAVKDEPADRRSGATGPAPPPAAQGRPSPRQPSGAEGHLTRTDRSAPAGAANTPGAGTRKRGPDAADTIQREAQAGQPPGGRPHF